MSAAGPDPRPGAGTPIYTVGHSHRPADEMIDLLRAHGIRAVADVRRYPRSRRHPWFDAEAFAPALAAAGIGYEHWPALGGYREPAADSPHTGLDEPMLRGYAGHMAGDEFGAALDRLIAAATARPSAVMCAEADPRHCHRWLLADALVTRGLPVLHVTGLDAPVPHVRTPWVRVEDGRLVYDRGAARLPGL